MTGKPDTDGNTERPQKDGLLVIAGAGGFIGGSLVHYFQKLGYANIRAIDKKPLSRWFQRIQGVENLSLDLSQEKNCQRAVHGAREVYNLAAEMGGMGFIQNARVECMRNVLINTHLLESAGKAGVERYFFASSAAVYNTRMQESIEGIALKESDAYPANAQRGYGWEKLFSEMMCQEYNAEGRLKTFIARFHNVHGPFDSWDGGREKALAALTRSVLTARYTGSGEIPIWGDGQQTRSYMYIDDCVQGIDRITHCDTLAASPVNLGSSSLISINDLVSALETLAGIRVQRKYKLDAPRGVIGRSSDNSMILKHLGWQPSISLDESLPRTYAWIEEQYLARSEGRKCIGG